MSKRQATETTEVEPTEAVWVDDDDIGQEVTLPKVRKTFLADVKKKTDQGESLDSEVYVERLKEVFKRRHGETPSWATKLNEKEDDEDDDGLLKSASGYIKNDNLLPKTNIKTHLVKNFDLAQRSTKSLNVVRFHKKRPVLLTADASGIVRLFKVSDEANSDNFLQSVQFKMFPVDCMDIGSRGQSAICSSKRQQYLMNYDMESGSVTQIRTPKAIPQAGIEFFALSDDSQVLAIAGKSCHVYILAANTMEHIKTISLPQNATSLKFFPGGNRELWIMTQNGQVVMCDTRGLTRHVFSDDGFVHGTCVTVSKHGEFLATGGDTGIVNVYNGASARSETAPTPLFTINNLTTSVSSIAFNHDAQILAICSNIKKAQCRLVHMRSQTVFKNFPERHVKITSAKCVDFSPKGAFMALGNGDGRLQVIRVSHFSDY